MHTNGARRFLFVANRCWHRASRTPLDSVPNMNTQSGIFFQLWARLAHIPHHDFGAPALTFFFHLLIYAPPDRRSPACVLVRAIPGAMLSLIGCTAALSMR